VPSPPLVIPPALRDRARRQEGLVSTRQARDAGLTDQQVHRLLRSGRWQRVTRGVHDTSEPGRPELDPHDGRRRRAALTAALACPTAVVSGAAALVLHGVQGAPLEVTPEVTTVDGTSRRGPRGVVVRRWAEPLHAEVEGFRVARVDDALLQAAWTVGRRHGVALMDSARQQLLVSPEAFALAAARDRRRPGGRGRAAWWTSSDPRAESPAETWARLTCTDRGFPPDVLQLPVDDGHGRPVARVDLAWRLPDGTVLLVEIDGHDVHSLPGAVLHDRARQNLLLGARLLRFTGREAWDGTAARRVAAVLLAGGWRPRVPPPGYRYRIPS
jgi:hypothetical protein